MSRPHRHLSRCLLPMQKENTEIANDTIVRYVQDKVKTSSIANDYLSTGYIVAITASSTEHATVVTVTKQIIVDDLIEEVRPSYEGK